MSVRHCWGDLRVEKDEEGKNVLVVSVRGETSKVRRGRSAVAYGENIIGVLDEYRKLTPYNNDTDLVFGSKKKGEDSFTPVDLSKQFQTFLTRCPYEHRKEGLRFSADGKSRTLYSLRHFYAIQRLQQNVDVFQLATSMGTGVSNIRNHYGRHISGDAFIKELTKYQSKSSQTAKNAAVRKLLDMVESGVLNEEIAMEAFRQVVEVSR